jgi:hypothetical protein
MRCHTPTAPFKPGSSIVESSDGDRGIRVRVSHNAGRARGTQVQDLASWTRKIRPGFSACIRL